ncbi:MAG: YciI family protein [Flavisolibacter sp.]
MKEFLLVFRRDFASMGAQPSPEQMQGMMKHWQDWMGGIAAQNKMANTGSRLGSAGKVVTTNNVVIDGPYAEIKESIGGYIIVKASSLEEATELAKNCPVLLIGGNVEVRPLIAVDDNS